MIPTAHQWAVIGAGPAGIACVGLLLDSQVPPSSILWIDPHFKVGDFGTLWREVSSNTTVGLFLRFYRQCKSFEFGVDGKKYEIEEKEEKGTCELKLAAEPLQDITDRLRKKVTSVEGEIIKLQEHDAKWKCITASSSFLSANVILATGAVPNTLSLHHHYPTLQEIPVSLALNPDELARSVTPSDTVAIIGASHTAIILIRALVEKTEVKKIVNFYREPLKYALYFDDWILYDDTGLKGDTARWARAHMHGNLPDRVERVYSDESELKTHLPSCTKIIYATGFTRREVKIDGFPSTLPHNPHTGIIAPGLFGCGIGFPEKRTDRYGNVESRVGLWKFIEYLERALPLWKRYSVGEGIGQPKGAV